tara:strand:- start:73877 stop:74110 length:234 start_codon:yes stop_codon:yes gene_type:complete
MSAPHKRFTVSRRGECWTLHHQAPPVDVGEGLRSISLRFPVLVAAPFLDDSEATLHRIADVLNAHWNDPVQPQEETI